MSKLGNFLEQHLHGEVLFNDDALDYFSTDASILKLRPRVIVYPRNTADVRKVARFTWQLAEKGKPLPITARGKGTDQTGASLGKGVMMVFPAHMNKLLKLEKGYVTTQPGMMYKNLQNTLHTHGRFLPPYPSSIDFCTIGGAIANNAAGEKSVKYGDTKKFTESLKVVLANGELIKTERISKRELSKKQGLSTMEGEVYRQIDRIIEDNFELLDSTRPPLSRNAAGYDIWSVKDKDGSFDLTPLLVGSQGTLGIITQATLETEAYTPDTHLTAAFFDDLESLGTAVLELKELNPSALELVDKNLLEFLKENKPKQLEGIIDEPFPAAALLIEFDDNSKFSRKRRIRKAKKVLKEYSVDFYMTEDKHEQETYWKIRDAAAAILWENKGKRKAIPVIEDGIVPVEKLPMFIRGAYKLFEKYDLEIAVWGHAGDGNLHMQPFLDISAVNDRQKIVKLMDSYYSMIHKLGGSITAQHNDGRIRGPYLEEMYGEELYGVFEQIKQAFDPYGTLNTGVKLGAKKDDITKMMRDSYTMKHLYDHMPRL